MPPESSSEGRPWITGRRTAFILGGIVSGLAVILLFFFSHQGLYKIYCLKQERTRLERENARLAEENARLARTIDRLHHDPEMIQDLIRRELNFIKKNEIIVQLPEEPGAKPAVGALPPPQTHAAKKEPASIPGSSPTKAKTARSIREAP